MRSLFETQKRTADYADGTDTKKLSCEEKVAAFSKSLRAQSLLFQPSVLSARVWGLFRRRSWKTQRAAVAGRTESGSP